MSESREFLGKNSGLASRQRIYRISNGLEVDDIDHYQITRRRVFFDDVIGLTYHRTVGLLFVLSFAFAASVFGAITTVTMLAGEGETAAVFGFFTAAFAIPAILRLILRMDVITVFGRRTKATLNFTYRKGRARALFEELATDIRRHQEELARAYAAERATRPVAAPEFPMPAGDQMSTDFPPPER